MVKTTAPTCPQIGQTLVEQWRVRVTVPDCQPAWTCKTGWLTTEDHADDYSQQQAELVVEDVRSRVPNAGIQLVRQPTRLCSGAISIQLIPSP